MITLAETKVVTPKDKRTMQDKFWIRLPKGYVVEPNHPMNYMSLFIDKDTALAAMNVGDVLFECDHKTRYVCKQTVEEEGK